MGEKDYDDRIRAVLITFFRIHAKGIADSREKNMDINGKMITVIIISDYGFMREGLRTLVESLPEVTVLGTTNGVLVGKKMVIELAPQLVIVDCTLSNSKGLEFVRILKMERIPARCLAIVESFEDSQKALTLGADGALIKGFTRNDLVRVLKRMIDEPIHTGSCNLSEGG